MWDVGIAVITWACFALAFALVRWFERI